MYHIYYIGFFTRFQSLGTLLLLLRMFIPLFPWGINKRLHTCNILYHPLLEKKQHLQMRFWRKHPFRATVCMSYWVFLKTGSHSGGQCFCLCNKPTYPCIYAAQCLDIYDLCQHDALLVLGE